MNDPLQFLTSMFDGRHVILSERIPWNERMINDSVHNCIESRLWSVKHYDEMTGMYVRQRVVIAPNHQSALSTWSMSPFQDDILGWWC